MNLRFPVWVVLNFVSHVVTLPEVLGTSHGQHLVLCYTPRCLTVN